MIKAGLAGRGCGGEVRGEEECEEQMVARSQHDENLP